MMKNFLACLIAFSLLLTSFALASEETPLSVRVFVSITDDTGALTLAHEALDVTDADGDGALTIHDALIAAHAVRHENGAEAYAAAATEFGLSMTRLWGAENGGSYGYYLNHASAWSLLDPVREGDHVKVYAFTDLTAWSDTYCYFDADSVEAAAGAQIVLTLLAAGYDEAWNPVTLPVADAIITVHGEATEIRTDAEGKAVLFFEQAGVYTVSAFSETQTLVAPVCIVKISE